MKKKLQVFVSSTYTDLIDERQAAVQAILDAGHIPAGMELFKAGNESQLKTIYKWIDESDVYMLILGGRYGSIEEESGLSYTELEYRYALSKEMPVFAVVLSESFLTQKINSLKLSDVMEQRTYDKYREFKSFVMSKIIREVDDCKDIIIQVHATLNEFMHEYDLTGWVRNSNENDTLQLLKDNNSLNKEIVSLNKQIQNLQKQLNAKPTAQFGDYSFDELSYILQNKYFSFPGSFYDASENNIDINALVTFKTYYNDFCTGIPNESLSPEENEYLLYNICPYYLSFNLLKKVLIEKSRSYEISEIGARLYAEIDSNYIE